LLPKVESGKTARLLLRRNASAVPQAAGREKQVDTDSRLLFAPQTIKFDIFIFLLNIVYFNTLN
jgi:hypothetical protein